MKKLLHKIGTLPLLHEVFFSLNVGFALAFALRIYIDLPRQQWLAERLYPAVNRLFHLTQKSAGWVMIVFIGAMLGIAGILFLLLLSLRSGSPAFYRAVLDPLACVLALVAAPASWIGAIMIGWPPDQWWNAYPAWPGVTGFWFLGIEAALTFVLLQIVVRWQNPVWSGVLILVAHYSIWAWYMWPAMSHEFWPFSSLSLLQSFAMATPCSGLVWLLYVIALRENAADHQIANKIRTPRAV